MEARIDVASEEMIQTFAPTAAFQLKVCLEVIRDANKFPGVSKDECAWGQDELIVIFEFMSDPSSTKGLRAANATLGLNDITQSHVN